MILHFNGTWKHQLSFELNYTQDVRSNTTTYKITQIYIGGGYAINYNTRGARVHFSVNGEEKSFEIGRLDLSRNGWKYLGDLTWTVPHNQDGSKSFELVISCDLSHVVYQNLRMGSVDYRQNITLVRILRGSEILSSIPKTLNSNNPSFSAQCRIHNRNFETIWELYYTSPQNNYEWLGATVKDSENVTLTIPRNQIDRLANFYPTAQSAGITLILVTRDRNTQENIHVERREITFYFTSEYYPTITNITLQELNSKVSNLQLGLNTYLQKHTNLKPTITADAKANATISKYEVMIKNVKKESTNNYFNLQLEDDGNIDLIFTVIDSRGFKTTQSKRINVIPYFTPKILKFAVQRDIRNVLKVISDFETQYANVLNKNNYSLTIQSKEKNSNTWNSVYTISNQLQATKKESNYLLSGTFIQDRVYELKLIIQDKFESWSVTSEIGVATYSADFGKRGMAVGGLLKDENYYGLQVYGNLIDEHGNNYLKGSNIALIEVNSFASGVTHAPGYAKAKYHKDVFNRVYLYGVVKASSSAYTLFTLPLGYRPSTTKYYPVVDNNYNPAFIRIIASGEVQAVHVPDKNFICLDGINFVVGT